MQISRAALLVLAVLVAGCGHGSGGQKQETDALLENLRSGGTQHRAHAARRLGELQAEAAVGALTEALRDREEQVRLAAIEALGRIGTRETIQPLCGTLKSQAWTERRAAAEALGAVGDVACVTPLVSMLGDENSAAAGATVQSLIAIGAPAVEPLMEVVRASAIEIESWPPAEEARTEVDVSNEKKANKKPTKGKEDPAREAGVVGSPVPVDPETTRRRAVIEKIERAVYALGEIGDRRAVEVIRPLLELPHDTLSVTAAVGLSKLGELQAVEFLVDRLGAADPVAETMARSALERMGTTALEPLCRAASEGPTDQRRAAVKLLARLDDPRVLSPLLAVSVDSDGRVRSMAEQALQSRLALDAALDQLLEALDHENPSIRRTALTLIGKSGQSFPVDAVTPLLEDEDPVIRAAAAGLLGQQQEGKITIEPLARLIDDEDERVRFAAAAALSAMGDRRANGMFLEVVKTGDVTHPYFASAVKALGDTAERRATDHLLPLLTKEVPKDRDQARRLAAPIEEARRAAVKALGRIGDRRATRPIARLIEADTVQRGVPYVEVGEALGRLGDPAAFDPLVKFLQTASFRTHGAIRRPAMHALVKIDPRRAVDALTDQLLHHVDPVDFEQNRDICLIFAELKHPRTIATLAERLASDAPEQRRDAARALIEVVRANVPEAVAAMEEVSAGGRAGIASALAEIGQPAHRPLVEALESDSAKIRHGAAWAVGETGDPELGEALLPLVEDEHTEVRAAAAWSLGQLEYEPACDALIGLLADTETKPRMSAAHALGSFKAQRVVAALVAAWGDADAQVRREVLRALMRTGSPDGRKILQRALEDEDTGVRALAARIVKDIARHTPK